MRLLCQTTAADSLTDVLQKALLWRDPSLPELIDGFWVLHTAFAGMLCSVLLLSRLVSKGSFKACNGISWFHLGWMGDGDEGITSPVAQLLRTSLEGRR